MYIRWTGGGGFVLCPNNKVVEDFRVEMGVQKGVLKFREKLDIDVLVSFNICFQ